MKAKLSILLLASLVLYPFTALSADKSVIVGFHNKPGHAERRLIQNRKGKIKRNFRLIKAMSVVLSEEEIEKLFAEGNTFTIHPYRVFWLPFEEQDTPLKFAIGVPKKRFKNAVDRVSPAKRAWWRPACESRRAPSRSCSTWTLIRDKSRRPVRDSSA